MQPSLPQKAKGPSFPLEASLIPPECRRPFAADNGRIVDRFSERELERVPFSLRRASGPWIPVLFQDYSLFGFGVLIDPVRNPNPPGKGEQVEARISLPGSGEVFSPCEIVNAERTERGIRLGMIRLDGTAADFSFSATGSISVDQEDPILVSIRNPVIYQETGEAILTGLYPGKAMTFKTRDPSLFLIPGTVLEMEFILPSRDEAAYIGKVVWSRRDGLEVVFGVVTENMSRELSEALGEYLLLRKMGTPSDAHRLGFYFKVFQERLRFTFARSKRDYAQVLALRRNAYVGAGKRPSDTRPEDMGSDWDRKCRIVCAKHEDKVVGCVALTFPDAGDPPLRTEAGFPGKKYPVRIAPKQKMIEVVNLCTDPAYRNGDLLRGMFTHIARTFLLSDRESLVTVCTHTLWPLYKKIGFKDTGRRCPFLGIEHRLIFARRAGAVCGRGMNPMVWVHLFGDMVGDLIATGLLVPTWRENLRIRLFLLGRTAINRWMEKKWDLEYERMLREHRPDPL